LAYFRQRYFANGVFTYHFDHLHLRPNDQIPLIRSVIDGSNNDPCRRVATVLIVILRYRNNLFHGMKWQYDELAGQLDNFTNANNALMTALEHYGQLARLGSIEPRAIGINAVLNDPGARLTFDHTLNPFLVPRADALGNRFGRVKGREFADRATCSTDRQSSRPQICAIAQALSFHLSESHGAGRPLWGFSRNQASTRRSRSSGIDSAAQCEHRRPRLRLTER
jgi:hypothetical protein